MYETCFSWILTLAELGVGEGSGEGIPSHDRVLSTSETFEYAKVGVGMSS